uniref:Major facilitator superfamily (MFS) profile domain-containing protein n=1 Tax=Romanomermis culicivorax TaxID=13658 RepID=A0A915J9R8_ROMCU
YCSHNGDAPNLHFYRNFCPSNLAWLSITALALYLCSFAAGFGPLPWTICAEIFDNKSRSLGTSITTTVNWTANLLVSLTFLTLTQALSRQVNEFFVIKGAFLLYAGLSTVGLVLFYIFLPETKYHTLDDVEFLIR